VFSQTQGNTPAFVITASRPEILSSDELDTNDVDRHVSLEVRCADFTVPRLYKLCKLTTTKLALIPP